VDKPDLYDPKINRSYAELAAHYGCLIDPASAIKPRDKPQAAYCTSSGRFVRSWASARNVDTPPERKLDLSRARGSTRRSVSGAGFWAAAAQAAWAG
jgi:hypothetical protein